MQGPGFSWVDVGPEADEHKWGQSDLTLTFQAGPTGSNSWFEILCSPSAILAGKVSDTTTGISAVLAHSSVGVELSFCAGRSARLASSVAP